MNKKHTTPAASAPQQQAQLHLPLPTIRPSHHMRTRSKTGTLLAHLVPPNTPEGKLKRKQDGGEASDSKRHKTTSDNQAKTELVHKSGTEDTECSACKEEADIEKLENCEDNDSCEERDSVSDNDESDSDSERDSSSAVSSSSTSDSEKDQENSDTDADSAKRKLQHTVDSLELLRLTNNKRKPTKTQSKISSLRFVTPQHIIKNVHFDFGLGEAARAQHKAEKMVCPLRIFL